MLILNADEVRRALPMDQTIEVMKQAYAALSDGRAEVPLRTRLPIPAHAAASLIMPAYVRAEHSEALGVKIVSLYPKNPEQGLAFIQAVVLVLEASTGRPAALLEGGALTDIRTGAAGGAAADILARPESRVAAIFGAGTQGRTQLEAVCAVRPIETAWIFDPDPRKCAAFADEMSRRGTISAKIKVADSPAQTVQDADIICTATTSNQPVFSDHDLKAGAHISAIGSYTPEMQEVPAETIRRARVVVDSVSAALAEAGDLIQPLRQGLITDAHIQAELGEIILGRKPGRASPQEITYFKSVGLAVQDVLAAQLALTNAAKLHLGNTVEL